MLCCFAVLTNSTEQSKHRLTFQVINLFRRYLTSIRYLHVTNYLTYLLNGATAMSTPNTTIPSTTSPAATPDLQSTLGLSGVDLIAMLVSDSGLASCEPKWWNASPNGCMLLGLQPRGGWQIVQRAVQWGSDSWANCFGVDCAAPTLYAYFACSIRNRLETLASSRLRSPMEGVTTAGAPWRAVEGEFTVKRPTKLIDGSRGGQAFIAAVLAPEKGTHYSIADQSRVQMLSVLMVGAGLVRAEEDAGVEGYMGRVLPWDFDLDSGLGSVFARLAVGLSVASIAALGMMIATWWSLVRETNLFGSGLPYVVKVVSLMCWAIGAMGLLMLGGSPSVKVVVKKVPKHTQKKLAMLRDGVGKDPDGDHKAEVEAEADGEGVVEADLDRGLSSPTSTSDSPDAILSSPQSTATGLDSDYGQAARPRLTRGATTMSGNTLQAVASATPETGEGVKNEWDKKIAHVHHVAGDGEADPRVMIEFGSLHGSVFIADRGYCMLRMSVVERLCATDIRTTRTVGWYAGMGWFGLLLLGSIALQVGATLAPAFGADLMSLIFLLASALARGAGIAGPEEWMIPKWKRRHNAVNGAVLLGQFDSRAGASEV